MRPVFGSLFSFALTFPGCFSAASRVPAPEPPQVASLFPRVGQPAPEIDGEDLDGVPFKLSDYRGKIVVLDFWGHW